VTSTIVNDFRAGVDRRRKRVSGPPGSLWTCINAHLTRGGDIEKRKKFVPVWTVPSNTFGFKKTTAGAYVFGSVAPGTLTLPAGITYQRLVSPSPENPYMTKLNDVTLFDGKVYAVATFSDGNTHHFYDGAYVAAWDDGVVRSYTTDLDEVASRICALINANATEVVTATVSGTAITITAKADNTSFVAVGDWTNGGTTADEAVTITTAQAATSTQPQITTATLSGALEVGDRYAVTINANQYGAGDNPASVGVRLFTHGQKVYAMVGPSVYFCAVDDPLSWRANVNGGGRLNMSNNEEGTLEVVGAARYQGDVAFFAHDSAQVWTLDPDPTINSLSQVIEQTGAVAGRTPFTYGNNDTFYLSRSGSRSVRSRSVSGGPFVTDIGNAIDTLLISHMRELGPDTVSLAQSMMETVDGRYMLALGNRIYVLSYFPGSKIEGWTWYEPTEIPDFSADWVSVHQGKLYIRSGNAIYLYGGEDGNTYDSSAEDNYVVSVGLPFLGGKKLFEQKELAGWDMAVENEWVVKALTDPRNENIKTALGSVDEITYADLDLPAAIDGEMFALEMTCKSPGPATISNFAMHFGE
jgi:hypothetical protein